MGRKRKCVVSGGGGVGDGGVEREEPRNAANERERDRMRVLSAAFVQLKKSLPWVPSDTKLSKLDTLLMATRYIRYLRHLLVEDLQATLIADAGTHPVNLTWPYAVQSSKDAQLLDVGELSIASTETVARCLIDNVAGADESSDRC